MTPIQTPSIFAPVSTPAYAIRDLSFIVLAISAAIFLIVAGFAIYTLIRFGRRSPNPEVEPAQVYGSTQIELAWTVVPLLMLLMVVVHPQDEFRTWVAAQQATPAEPAAARAGRELFSSLPWGTPGNGVFGPDLTHLMSRSTLGAG